MTKTTEHRDQTLLLIDSHALIHRAYHAFPPTLTNAKGQLTNAVYGYTSLLLDVLIKFKPSHVVAVFDSPGDTVRHDRYAAYKANRSSPDDELVVQIPAIEEMLKRFDIPITRMSGYEADDLIGTLDRRHSGEWAKTIIVTGDRDLFQLVDEDTFVYLAGSSFSQSKLFGIEDVKEKMGVGPDYIVDIKSLEGDASDNIPGVAGIGKKGAVDLVSQFGHLDQIYDRIEELPNRYKNKLEENYEMAVLSKELATIITDAPFHFDFESAPFGTYNLSDIKEFFLEMEFASLMGRLNKLAAPSPSAKLDSSTKQSGSTQGTLFGEPEKPLPDWNGSQVNSENIAVVAKYEKSGDPLTWVFTKLSVKIGDNLINVPVSKLEQFWKSVKVGWVITDDSKSLIHCLLNLGISPTFATYDVVISTYLTSGGQIKQDLASACNWYQLGLVEKIADKLDKMVELYNKQKHEISDNQQWKKLIVMEQKLVSVVAAMERSGVILDSESLAVAHDKLSERIDQVQQEVFEQVGHEFNIGSPKQVGEVLFEELGLPSGKKTKTGSYSTDERILREIVDVNPVVELILEYRELTKLLSTYVKPLPLQVNKQTGRIHAEFNQLGAVTGRFSSKNPNMQNIPLGEVAGVNIRESIVSAQGSVFVAFDYSQQELRLLAELSGEKNMQKAFQDGLDVHALTASEIFNVDINDVTKKQRQVGKTINFGVVYGMSAYGFADRLKVAQGEAIEFINKYFNEYPRVQKYFDELIDTAKTEGYVETIMGRRRGTVALKSSNYQVRKATEREVMNFPLQGSAADIIKAAMLGVTPILEKYPAKLILQVHDELIFEYETDLEVEQLSNDNTFESFVVDVKSIMLDVVKLTVPLTVGVEVGKSWGGLHDLVT